VAASVHRVSVLLNIAVDGSAGSIYTVLENDAGVATLRV